MSRYRTAAGQQVAELAAKTADAGRLARGRTLFRKGAVRDFYLDGSSIVATVRGSQGDDYSSTVATSNAPPGVVREVTEAAPGNQTVNELIDLGVQIVPRDIDLVFDCTCADWEEPCKHSLATLMAFADHVDGDPNELLVWRGIEEAPPVIAQVRPGTFDRDGGSIDGPDRKEKISELEALLGASTRRATANREADKDDGPDEPLMHPDLVVFLGLGLAAPDAIEQVAVARPLFTQREAGPLAELGPHLSEAIDLIQDLVGDH